jgi:hypothetical protein
VEAPRLHAAGASPPIDLLGTHRSARNEFVPADDRRTDAAISHGAKPPGKVSSLRVGKKFSANIALPMDLHGAVTASLHEVTLDQALTTVLTPLGYSFSHKNGVVVVFRSSVAVANETAAA